MKSIKLFIYSMLLVFPLTIACMNRQKLGQYESYLAQALPEAIRTGQLEQVKKLISKGAELESDAVVDALWDAHEDDHREMVRFVLDKKLDYLLKHETPNQVLQLALQSRYMSIVQKLLETYKNLKIRLSTIKTLLSVLVTLAHELEDAQRDAQKKEEACVAYQAGSEQPSDQETDGLVDLLEDYAHYKELRRAAINAQRRVACYKTEYAQFEKIFDQFLTNQPNLVEAQDIDGQTLLDYAIRLKNVHYVELLIEHYKAKATIAGMRLALNSLYANILDKFFTNQPDLAYAQDRNGQTLLDHAVNLWLIDYVKLLLERYRAKATASSLYLVFNSLKTDRTVSSENKKRKLREQEELFVLLVSHSPNLINQQDAQRKTLLYYAIENSFVGYVQLLLEHGADVNIVNRDGLSLLQIAVNFLKTELMLSKMFIHNQAKALIAIKKNIVQLLFEAGANYASLKFNDASFQAVVQELYDKAQAAPSLERVVTKRVSKPVVFQNKVEDEGTIQFSAKLICQAAKKGNAGCIKALLQKQNIGFEKLLDNNQESKKEREKLYKLIELLEADLQRNGRRYNFHRKRTGTVQEVLSLFIDNNPDMFDEQNLSITGHQLWDLIKIDQRFDILEMLRKRFGREATSPDENSIDNQETEAGEAVTDESAEETQDITKLLLQHGAQSGILLNRNGRVRVRKPKRVTFEQDLVSVFSAAELLS